MYQYFGWLRLREAEDGSNPGSLEEIFTKVETEISLLEMPQAEIGIRWLNGSAHIWLTGYANRAEPDREVIHGFVRKVISMAQGTYGLIYERDDESEGEDSDFFVVLSIGRGGVQISRDTLLSPCSKKIE
ncbi:MAG: Imm7 family immunity protein [Nitrospirota bacterium]